MNQPTPEYVSQRFMQKLADGDQKGAMEAGTDFTRLTLREEGLLRKILPSKKITHAQLDKQVDTDKPVKIIDKEVSQPLSVSVPFGTLPVNQYIRGGRYKVNFERLVTPNYVKDQIELGTYDYDIREVFKDNAVKDHMTAEDVPWFNLCRTIVSSTSDPTALVGNAASQMTGRVQYYDFTSAGGNPQGYTGFSRDSLFESFKIMTKGYGDPKVSTPIRLISDVHVMNANTGLEFCKMLPTEVGWDISEKLMTDGLVQHTWGGRKFIFTLKDDVVLDGEMWMFAKPQFLGVFFELEEPTMFIENRAFLLEFFLYSCIGATVGNAHGIALAKFF